MVRSHSKKNLNKQADQETRFQAMFETVADGIITIDDRGIIENFNPSAEKLFGYGKEEVIGQNVSMLMGDSHRAKHDGYIRRYLETNEARVINIGREVQGRCKDGRHFPFELTVSEISLNGQRMFTGVVRDISAQQGNRRLLKVITSAQQEILREIRPQIIFDKLLAELLSLTQSEYGFIGEISYTDANDPVLTTHAITNIAWNDETRRFYENNAPEGMKFTNTDTLFGEVMTTCKPVISNDPANDPRSGGLPNGHPSLDAFLGLPFFSREEFVGMVGLANCPGGYDEALIEFLQPFLVTCSNLIATLRLERKREEVENTLRESEARGRAILTGATEAIVTINGKGIIEDVNPATEKIFGYRFEEMLGQNVKMLMPDPYQSNHDGYLAKYADTGMKNIIGEGREVVGRRNNGQEFPMFLSVNHITVGGRNMFTVVIRDISEQRLRAEELRKLNDDLSTRVSELNSLNDVNFQLNAMNSFFQSAENQEELYETVSKFCRNLFPMEVGAFFRVEGDETMEICASWGGKHEGDDYFKNSDCWAMRKGEVKVLELGENHLVCNHLKELNLSYAVCQPVATREGMVGMLSVYAPLVADMDTEQQKNQIERNKEILDAIADRLGVAISNLQLREKLKQESIRDPLTNLFNRRFFDETSELEIRRSKRSGDPISIVLLDADHFKKFNDTYGHEAGDVVLQEIAEILHENCRSQDIPCRYGGEEFALVFVGLDKKAAMVKAEEVRKSVEKRKILYGGKALPKLTISCGVAAIPSDGNDLAACLRAADTALYQAKESGRNQVIGAGGTET